MPENLKDLIAALTKLVEVGTKAIEQAIKENKK